MFYSHEVLSNSQHGVATIWLVATVGKGSQRKLNRKTIQQVNVPKACEKILDPGAPLALRLQGNLLFGVSRVFSHQCDYVLSDAEKTQSDMMTFFRSINTSETDPKAGKAKRHQIVLNDDPEFDLMAALPRLEELLGHDSSFNFMSTQESANKFSQMSPLDRTALLSASTSRRSSIVGLDLPPSSHSIGSYRLPGDLCNSSPFNKAFHEADTMPDFRPFADDEIDPICGIDLDFDADGNLVSIVDAEPELPPLRGTSPDPLHAAEAVLPRVGNVRQQIGTYPHDEDILDFGEAAFSVAERVSTRQAGEQANTDALTLTTDTTETAKSSAPLRAARRRKLKAMVDEEIRISRDEFRGWTENYVFNMDAARKRAKATSLAKAKKNALALMYNNGISDIGILEQKFGVEHPLSADLAGTALKAHLFGLVADEIEDINVKRGRRRKSPEAFGLEENDARSVRQRLELGDEFGRGEATGFGGGLDFGEETAPEIGREAETALEDKHSSSFMPWSRQGSAVPESATRAPGSAQKSMAAPSPLHGRGSLVGSLERHSDPIEEAFVPLGLDPQHSSAVSDDRQEALNIDAGDKTNTPTSDAGLDTSTHQFLGYAARRAANLGVAPSQDDQHKRWIDFDELATPGQHSKAIATQAFLHVLTLATKNVISVQQDGIDDNEPFGKIYVGLGS
ncbi:R8 protein [Conoideocrella luteorostrata]|uniref:R8 protein n=1 Tax=Conoideocrella luteorostrata TaxID=1105319 RepID=A0AAJ0CGU3_9HYPO|nr:R8 protein [Conoideocrella luteorostrata]